MGTRNFPDTGTELVYCLHDDNNYALNQLRVLIDKDKSDIAYVKNGDKYPLRVYSNEDDTTWIYIDDEKFEVYMSLKVKIVGGYSSDKCFVIEDEINYDSVEYNNIDEFETDIEEFGNFVREPDDIVNDVKNALSAMKKKIIPMLDQISDYKLRYIGGNMYEFTDDKETI